MASTQQDDIVLAGIVFQNVLSVAEYLQIDFKAVFPAVLFQILLHLLHINVFIFHQCDSNHIVSFLRKAGFFCGPDLFPRTSAFL
mgnify:CR=1 FL=1